MSLFYATRADDLARLRHLAQLKHDCWKSEACISPYGTRHVTGHDVVEHHLLSFEPQRRVGRKIKPPGKTLPTSIVFADLILPKLPTLHSTRNPTWSIHPSSRYASTIVQVVWRLER